jgi:Phosphotransferase enzyme family
VIDGTDTGGTDTGGTDTDGAVTAALESLLGPVERLEPVARGYTHNTRVVAVLRDGRSVFAKRAVDEMTAAWLRREHEMYEVLRERPFVPEMLGFADGERPLLVLENLSDATWPPPWDRRRVDAVLATLDAVAGSASPAGLPRLTDGEGPDEGWHHVLAHPDEFLSLGLCHADWLDRAGPVLASAAADTPMAGEELLHLDVRSDNLCFRGDSALLIDWNLVSVGNPQFDVAFWLPSLAAENGPAPDDVMPDCPAGLAAYVAGFFASRAGGPVIPHAPFVRRVQREQLDEALPWAARCLDLAPPAY